LLEIYSSKLTLSKKPKNIINFIALIALHSTPMNSTLQNIILLNIVAPRWEHLFVFDETVVLILLRYFVALLENVNA
jgi:hypothetical protein